MRRKVVVAIFSGFVLAAIVVVASRGNKMPDERDMGSSGKSQILDKEIVDAAGTSSGTTGKQNTTPEISGTSSGTAGKQNTTPGTGMKPPVSLQAATKAPLESAAELDLRIQIGHVTKTLVLLGKDFAVGDDMFVRVSLRSCAYFDVLDKRERPSRANKERVPAVDQNPHEEIVLGRTGTTWTDNLHFQLYRMIPDNEGVETKENFDEISADARIKITEETNVRLLKDKLSSRWLLRTMGLEPGTYRISAIFEINGEEDVSPEVWHGRLTAKADFVLLPSSEEEQELKTKFRELFAVALDDLKKRKYDSAIAGAKRALEAASPKEAIDVYKLLGNLYEIKGELGHAIEAWENVLSLKKRILPRMDNHRLAADIDYLKRLKAVRDRRKKGRNSREE